MRGFFLVDRDFDLFGLPDDPGRGLPGRPRKIATPEDRSKVNMLLAFGKSLEEIADVIGMSLPTFRRNFFQEIKARGRARERLRAAVLTATLAEAMKGNVQAQKLMLLAIEKQDLAERAAALDGKPINGTARPVTTVMGKKQAAHNAAINTQKSSTWGDDLVYQVPATRGH